MTVAVPEGPGAGKGDRRVVVAADGVTCPSHLVLKGKTSRLFPCAGVCPWIMRCQQNLIICRSFRHTSVSA